MMKQLELINECLSIDEFWGILRYSRSQKKIRTTPVMTVKLLLQILYSNQLCYFVMTIIPMLLHCSIIIIIIIIRNKPGSITIIITTIITIIINNNYNLALRIIITIQ